MQREIKDSIAEFGGTESRVDFLKVPFVRRRIGERR